MKKVAMLILMLMFVQGLAFAETVPMLDETVFDSAKQTLVYLAAGDYESAAAFLGIADAQEMSEFVDGNFTQMDSEVQTYVAVAFWNYNAWFIAVPLHDPVDGEVETIAFRSDDGLCISGYRYCTWADIENEYTQCDYVVWNEEYLPEESVFIIE